jgi:hypothetical protein
VFPLRRADRPGAPPPLFTTLLDVSLAIATRSDAVDSNDPLCWNYYFGESRPRQR